MKFLDDGVCVVIGRVWGMVMTLYSAAKLLFYLQALFRAMQRRVSQTCSYRRRVSFGDDLGGQACVADCCMNFKGVGEIDFRIYARFLRVWLPPPTPVASQSDRFVQRKIEASAVMTLSGITLHAFRK